MPKSTTTQVSLDALVGGDRVDEPVGADLARVVDPDRHPGPDRRPDDEHLVAEVALGHLGPLLGELRHRRGDDRARRCRRTQPAQREQVRERRAELVAGSTRARSQSASARSTPVASGREDAEVRLGVADVDDEQHRATLHQCRGSRRPRTARRPARPPSAAQRVREPAAVGSVSSGSSSSSGTSTKRRELTSGWGSVSRSDSYSRSPSSSSRRRSRAGRGGRRRPRARPRARPPCTRRAAARARARSRPAGRR